VCETVEIRYVSSAGGGFAGHFEPYWTAFLSLGTF
jgi:hypothetical protein